MDEETKALRERIAELEAERIDIRRFEWQRRELDSRIQHLQRMESLSVLAGGVAHEFNNLLTGILGNAGLAMQGLPRGSAARDCLHEIEVAAGRAAELSAQILAYAGRGPLLAEPVDLARLARETIDLLESFPGEGARIEFDSPPGLPRIRGDGSQIRQALTNVFSNAILALGERGGVIIVRTGVTETPPPAEAGGRSDLPRGAYAFVEVIDDGCGMEPAEVERAFEPFVSGRFGGRGLGLAAVHGIVRGHGGAVEIESRPGRGTRVRLLFPAKDDAPGKPPAEPQGETVPEGYRGRGLILVADDDETVLRVATRILAHLGFSILTARDGAEAVALIESRPGEFSAVLLDLVMQPMNGADALLEIRRRWPDLPVILSTGYSAVEAATRLAGLAVDGFVQKPYRREQLVAALHLALNPSSEG